MRVEGGRARRAMLCRSSRADLREERVVRGEIDVERGESRGFGECGPEDEGLNSVAGDRNAVGEKPCKRRLDVGLEGAGGEVEDAEVFEIAGRAVVRCLDRVVRAAEDERREELLAVDVARERGGLPNERPDDVPVVDAMKAMALPK